jgi:hypothetical protein
MVLSSEATYAVLGPAESARRRESLHVQYPSDVGVVIDGERADELDEIGVSLGADGSSAFVYVDPGVNTAKPVDDDVEALLVRLVRDDDFEDGRPQETLLESKVGVRVVPDGREITAELFERAELISCE